MFWLTKISASLNSSRKIVYNLRIYLAEFFLLFFRRSFIGVACFRFHRITAVSEITDLNIFIFIWITLLFSANLEKVTILNKIVPNIFQRPYLEGLIYGGKFALQNQLGLYIEANLRRLSKCKKFSLKLAVRMKIFLKLSHTILKPKRKLLHWRRNTQFKGKERQ